MPEAVLTKLGDVLETEQFAVGDYIIREGTVGDTFYIIAGGEVRVTKCRENEVEDMIRDLQPGDYFGEQVEHIFFLFRISFLYITNYTAFR